MRKRIILEQITLSLNINNNFHYKNILYPLLHILFRKRGLLEDRMKSILRFLSILSFILTITTFSYYLLEDAKYKVVAPSHDLFNVVINKQAFTDVIHLANEKNITLSIIEDNDQLLIHTNNPHFFKGKLNKKQIKLFPGTFYEDKTYVMKDITDYAQDSKSFFVNGSPEDVNDLFDYLKATGNEVTWDKLYPDQAPLFYLLCIVSAFAWIVTISLHFIYFISLKQKKAKLFRYFGYSTLKISRHFLSYSINMVTILSVFIYCLFLWFISKSFFVEMSLFPFITLFVLTIIAYTFALLLSISIFLLLSANMTNKLTRKRGAIFIVLLCFFFTMLNYTGIFILTNGVSKQFDLMDEKKQIHFIEDYAHLLFSDIPQDPEQEKAFEHNIHQLFTELNQYGVLISDAYHVDKRECQNGDIDPTIDPYCNTVIVNENYLTDILGLKDIRVKDDETLLLIPQMYRKKEKELVRLYQEMLHQRKDQMVIKTAFIKNNIRIPNFNIRGQAGNTFIIDDNPVILLLKENNLNKSDYVPLLMGDFKIDTEKMAESTLTKYINNFQQKHESTGNISVISSQQEFLDYYNLNKNLLYFIIILETIIFIIGYLGVRYSLKILIESQRKKYALHLIHGKTFYQVFRKEIFIVSLIFLISQMIIYFIAYINELTLFIYFPLSISIFVITTFIMFMSFEKITKELSY